MTVVEVFGTVVATAVGLTVLAAGFVRLVALPYLKEHLVSPVLARMDAMHDRDGELEAANRIAAYMFEGHMEASALDRGRIWEAINHATEDRRRVWKAIDDLRKARA